MSFAACISEPTDAQYPGVFNSDFSVNLEAWMRDALAKLAYGGDCPPDIQPPAAAGLAAARYRAVDVALSQLVIPADLHLGTDEHKTFGPITVNRRGNPASTASSRVRPFSSR